jgi:hypothetical protein
MLIPTIYAQVLDPKNAGIKTIDAKGVAVTDNGLAVLAGCNQEINADYEGSPRADTRCKEVSGWLFGFISLLFFRVEEEGEGGITLRNLKSEGFLLTSKTHAE